MTKLEKLESAEVEAVAWFEKCKSMHDATVALLDTLVPEYDKALDDLSRVRSELNSHRDYLERCSKLGV